MHTTEACAEAVLHMQRQANNEEAWHRRVITLRLHKGACGKKTTPWYIMYTDCHYIYE
jgi:hypothetical protein